MSDARNSKPALISIVIGLQLAGAGVYFAISRGAEMEDPVAEPSPVSISPDSEPPLAEARPSPSPSPSPSVAAPRAKPSRMARDLARERIWEGLSERHGLQPAAEGSAAPSPSAASLLPSLDTKYVRDALKQQFVPVALDCYNAAPDADRSLGTNMRVEVTIVGFEEVGGIIEEIEMDADTPAFMRECLRESTLALILDPPPVGGRAKAKYPVVFAGEHEG